MKTDITVLLDRSGSMENIVKDMEGGFAAYLAELRKVPGEADVTVAQFDDVYETLYVAQPLATAPLFALVPRGSTALRDAMGRCIDETGRRLAALPLAERPARVLFVVITDGGENASRNVSREQLVAMIAHQRDVYKWDFIYLGANQDSFAEAGSMGMNVKNAGNFAPTPAGVKAAYSAAAVSTNRYREGGSAEVDDPDGA